MSTNRKRHRRYRPGALAAAMALLVALAAPARAAATVASPIRAVFLKEFSKSSYQMDRGQILVFENDDPFLVHGIAGSLLADPVAPGGSRLVRNSPYLSQGSYFIYDPLHPEMISNLTVLAGGTPAPPDTALPSGGVKVLPARAAKIAKRGVLSVRVSPSEPIDATLKVSIGGTKAGSVTQALPDALPRVLSVPLTPQAIKLARPGAAVSVRARLVDVTGKFAKKRAGRRLSGGKKK
jgi:hypothetical protein